MTTVDDVRGGLTTDQVERFERDGYLVVEDVIDPASFLDPIVEEFEGVLDRLATSLHADGVLSDAYAGLPLSERLTRMYVESGKAYHQYFDPTLPQVGLKADTPMWVGPGIFALLRNERLLDVIESLIGPEIMSNPVQHVRIKPPEQIMSDAMRKGGGGPTQWHQDVGNVTVDADETQMLTVWMPLFEASTEMGCLVVVPGSHHGGLLEHCASSDHSRLEVPKKLFAAEAGVPVPMRRGSVIVMHRKTLHSSLPNVSDRMRWSLDLRYHPVGQPSGRAAFPGFVARSRTNPASELRDAQAWADMWFETRRALSQNELPRFNRWNTDSPACA